MRTLVLGILGGSVSGLAWGILIGWWLMGWRVPSTTWTQWDWLFFASIMGMSAGFVAGAVAGSGLLITRALQGERPLPPEAS